MDSAALSLWAAAAFGSSGLALGFVWGRVVGWREMVRFVNESHQPQDEVA